MRLLLSEIADGRGWVIQLSVEHDGIGDAGVTTYTDDDGMLVIRARLPSEIGAVFVKALEAASDKLYKDDSELPHERRRAEAMKVVAEAALNPGTSADRYQVIVHIDQPVLENPENEGQSTLEAGILELNRKTLDKISEDHPRVREVVQEFSDKRAGSIDEVMARST